MGAFQFKQIGKQGLLLFTLVAFIGGIKTASKLANAAVSPQNAAAENISPQTVPEFLVCSEAADWQRPSLEQQQKQLTSDSRYEGLVQEKEFQQLANQFWQHDVLSFTTYGLSARMEPINLSGLWSVADDVWTQCYSHDEGTAINEGTLAETWLMNYQVVDLQWQDGRYLMVVEPRSQGMQVVQFARRESAAELPLTVVTSQGTVIEHHNADW